MWLILEIYPDGGQWRHWGRSLRDARQIAEGLREAHKGRTVIVIRVRD